MSDRTGSELKLENGVYSLWARDAADPVEDGKLPGKNYYGTHPFYQGRSHDDKWFGVFTNFAGAQDWWIYNYAIAGDVDVRMYGIGGVADFYVMFADTPEQVTVLNQEIVGKPVLVPQWSLGWSQSRWGYKDI